MSNRYNFLRRVLIGLVIPWLVNAEPILLRTSAQEGTEPKFIQTAEGAVVGLCIDILRAMEKVDAGLLFVGDQISKPLIRAFADLESGMTDVQCAVQYTADRERRFNFVGPAIYSADYYLLVRRDEKLSVETWDDVRRLAPDNTVLVNRGFAAGEIIAGIGGFEVDASSTRPELNLQKLIVHRGRFYFHRGPGLDKLLIRTGTADRIKILPTVMYSAKLYFATSRKLDIKVEGRIARALAILEQSGELLRLKNKWD